MREQGTNQAPVVTVGLPSFYRTVRAHVYCSTNLEDDRASASLPVSSRQISRLLTGPPRKLRACPSCRVRQSTGPVRPLLLHSEPKSRDRVLSFVAGSKHLQLIYSTVSAFARVFNTQRFALLSPHGNDVVSG